MLHKSIEGITYAKNTSKAETFADDTSILTKFTEANLKSTVAIITSWDELSSHQAEAVSLNLRLSLYYYSVLTCVLMPLQTIWNIFDFNHL